MEKVLITGGAGFIGANLAKRLLKNGFDVTVYDNLSRPGARENVKWLTDDADMGCFHLVQNDVRNFPELLEACKGVSRVYHLAGQVAVTTSVKDPRKDFEENALGTFNALEAIRLSGSDPIFVYASTNKVYGGMHDVEIVEKDGRYAYADFPYGIPESMPLDFHSPYGCSKGAGDQYARDYHRIYGLRTIVMRQSCIYGYRQFGIEDQGWVAWFLIAALKGLPITIYGDGKQVRDILFIDDLLDAYDAAVDNIDQVAGEVFNVGGGQNHTLSVWTEFGPMLEMHLGHQIQVVFEYWRPGDQKVYISNINKIKNELGWYPKIKVEEGITRLYQWMLTNQELFSFLGNGVAHH